MASSPPLLRITSRFKPPQNTHLSSSSSSSSSSCSSSSSSSCCTPLNFCNFLGINNIWKNQSLRAHAMGTTQGNVASLKGVNNVKNEPDHLLVLVHGILASPSDWIYVEAELKRRLGRNFLIYELSVVAADNSQAMAPRRIRIDPTRRDDGVRKGRGLAKQTKKWGKEKLNVLFNEYGQPCGGECAKLASQLGYFVKNGDNFPLTVEWNQISHTILNNIWKDIQDNTNAPPEYKKICFASLDKQWKDWKCNVKSQWYNKYETDEERLANRPDSVKTEQLPALIAEWGSEKSKEISKTNKINRSKQEFPNRTGKVSHSQFRKKLEDEGKPTDRASIFIATRTDRAKEPVDLTTARMIQTLTDAIDELPEEEQSSPTKREQIFTNLLGKDGHGRLRCMGHGLTKTMVFGKAATGESAAAVRAELQEQMESQRLSMQAEIDAQKKAFQDFQRDLMQQLKGIGVVLKPMEDHDPNE